jgi:hypothetical protein
MVVKADSVKHETAEFKNKRLETVSWDANGRDLQPIRIHCYVIPGKEGRRLLAVFWASPEQVKKHEPQFKNIIESISDPAERG